MAHSLAIWLNDLQVAVVDRERKGKLRLSYTDEALAAYPGGVPLLSLDLPLTRDRYPNARPRGSSTRGRGGGSDAHEPRRSSLMSSTAFQTPSPLRPTKRSGRPRSSSTS